MDFFKAHHVKFASTWISKVLLHWLTYAQSMSQVKSDEAEENWPDPSRHLNELQHLRQTVQMPLKHPSTSSTTDTDTRRRPKPTDVLHKKSHSFFSTSPYLSSPQPLSESEASDSPFFPDRTASTKRRARSSSSAGYSPTPSTSSSRAPSAESPSKPFSFDKNKSWLQEASGSEMGSMSPNIDRKSSKRLSKDPRRKQEDKENRDPTRASAPKKIGSSSSTDLLDTLKGDIFKLTEMTTGRSDTTKQTSLARNTSHSRQLKPPFKPSEKTKAAARHLRASIERRYAVIADIINDGEVYNPLDVMKHRPLRLEDGETLDSFQDDRYMSLLDPWYVSTDEIVSDMRWRKAQLEQATKTAEKFQSEQDLNTDYEQQLNIPTSSGLMDHAHGGDTLMTFKEAVKAGPSRLSFAQRKGITSVSPSLSPASTPPQSPRLNNYTDPGFDSMAKDEEEGKELIEKRKSWSKPFFKKDKGKLKMKGDADAEVKKRYRNDEYLRFTQMSPTKDRELSPQLSNHSDSTFNDRPLHFGQTLLVPIDRHVSDPRGGHRRSLSTMDVLPVPTPEPLGTPEPFPSADVSEGELSSADSKKRPRLSSRRHSFDSLRTSSKGSHRQFGLWHDKHHRKNGPLHSDTDPLYENYSRGYKLPFVRSAHNSEYESDSNESDSKGHTRSRKGLGIRHFLKKETESTTKSPRISPNSQEEEEGRREHPPASVSPQPSLATRVALQEQRLRDMANDSSDQEGSLDLQSASDFEGSGIPNQRRSEESDQGSPTIPQDEEERHIVKLTLPYNDIPPEVHNMIQQYKAMDKAEITYATEKKREDEENSMDVADSIHTTDGASEADVTTESEADTEDNANDKNDDNKSDDDENTMSDSKAEDKIGRGMKMMLFRM
ncbi:hypothetical protein BC943DRAFT_215781 [Umbelopsis sp. AD052]|nr:hypothetical protein BC943DRAFT_215781 [Umbelopsis sp. AD052]